MKLSYRLALPFLAGAIAGCTLASFASALDYPTRPVRLVVGFPAGGSADIEKWWPIIKAANIRAE